MPKLNAVSCLALVASLCIGPLFVHAAPVQQAMPLTLPSITDPRYPVFVEQSLVLDSEGKVSSELFEPTRASIIEDLVQQEPVDPCVKMDWSNSGYIPQGGTGRPLSHWIETADNIIVAHVTGSTTGFHWQNPGTLVRAELIEVIKGKRSRQRYFVFLPEGIIEIGQLRLCYTTPGMPSPPEIGDQIVLLYSDISFRPGFEFTAPRSTGIIVLPEEGPARYSDYVKGPDKLENVPAESSTFLEYVREEATR